MSDYFDTDLPLFAAPARVGTSRKHHERIPAQQEVLNLLRQQVPVHDVMWKQRHPGSRIAPVVEKLRNAHGFSIDGHGMVKDPFRLVDLHQEPELVAVTDVMKEAYYKTEHWRGVRERRLRHDSYACVLCGDDREICVHHVFYTLFEEMLCHLLTVCVDCHARCHSQAKLKFPSGMRVEHARRLDCEWDIPAWTRPGWRVSA